jgi:hypothetical protein
MDPRVLLQRKHPVRAVFLDRGRWVILGGRCPRVTGATRNTEVLLAEPTTKRQYRSKRELSLLSITDLEQPVGTTVPLSDPAWYFIPTQLDLALDAAEWFITVNHDTDRPSQYHSCDTPSPEPSTLVVRAQAY